MLKTLRALAESYLFILVASLAIGLFVPSATALVAWNTLFLQAIFFLSSLKIEGREVVKQLKDWKVLFVATAVMLVGLPLVVRFLLQPILPDLAFPLFLLAAMPPGMTSPLLVEVMGGKAALALVITVTGSLLAPLTITLVTQIAYGSSVTVDAFAMFRSLAFVIFVPFILAMLVKRFVPAVTRINPWSKPVSIILLGLLVAGAVAQHAGDILASASSGWSIIRTILVLFLFFAALHVIGYWSVWWKPKEDRRSIAVCLTYMNFTLAIFLAATFFPRTEIVLPLVLSILPWATLLPAWKKISASRLWLDKRTMDGR